MIRYVQHVTCSCQFNFFSHSQKIHITYICNFRSFYFRTYYTYMISNFDKIIKQTFIYHCFACVWRFYFGDFMFAALYCWMKCQFWRFQTLVWSSNTKVTFGLQWQEKAKSVFNHIGNLEFLNCRILTSNWWQVKHKYWWFRDARPPFISKPSVGNCVGFSCHRKQNVKIKICIACCYFVFKQFDVC